MASSVPAESLLCKIQECSICGKRFKTPKVLDCSHTFCLKCLQILRERQDPRIEKLNCPTCGRGTVVTVDEVKDLPDDFILISLAEEVQMMDLGLTCQGSEIKCQSCDEENPAVSKCVECEHLLCQECQRAHQRLASMKSHKIYTLAQLRSGEAVDKTKQREVPKCGKHPDQNLRFYCNTCQQLVCKICFNLYHGGHPLTGLPEASEKCKEDVTGVATKIKQNMAELLSIAMDETSHKNLDAMFSNTNRKITEKADREVDRIREEERKLKQEVREMYNDRVKTFETAEATGSKEVSQAGHKLDEVNHIVSQLSCYVILHLKHKLLQEMQKLLHGLSELTGPKSERVPAFLDFEESDGTVSLGRLLDKPIARPREGVGSLKCVTRKGKWEMKTQIEKFGSAQTGFRWACGVATYSNDEIIVADSSHKQLIHFPTANPASRAVSQRLIVNCANPSCVAVNKDDHLIVLDSPSVKIFDRKRKYQLLRQFTPGSGPNSKPMCLAADDSNLIAVGYKDAEEISLHNPDGSLIRKLPAPMTVEHLAIYNRRLIYTNWDRKKLLAVDYKGGVVFSADTTSSVMRNWGPAGVCCDGAGNIYVAVCGFGSSSGEIHHFSPTGKHVGRVIEGCGSPRGIAFNANGDNLVVAAGDSVRIFHRV